MPNEKKYDDQGMRLTDCCGAHSTFSEDTLVCKGCWEPVGMGQGDGSEHKPSAMANLCDGCDDLQMHVKPFLVTHHDSTTSEAQYCPGCADLAREDHNGETSKIEPVDDNKPWIPKGGMVGRQWP